MRKTTTTAALAAVTTTIALAGGLAAPAQADSLGRHDPADVHHGVDLRAAHLNHADHNVWVTLNHTNLRRDPSTGAGGAVFLDLDPDDRGPEMVFVGGYFEGTDYALLHTDGFGTKTWGEPVEGSHRMTLDYGRDQTKMRISRAALGRPEAVRISVRVGGRRTDGTQVTDWLGEKFEWTPWVERG